MAHEVAVAWPSMDEWGEVLLNDQPYPVLGGVTVFDLATFPRKITFGDYSRESDDLLSTWVLADFSGGGQVYRLHEGVDQGRYWRGDLHLRRPYQITLNPLVQEFDVGETGSGWPLGDLDGTFYFAFDKAIHAWDEATEEFTDTGQVLAFQPVNTGVDWSPTDGGDPVLWVPYGADGYATFDGAAVSDETDATPVALAEFDDRLWGVNHDGGLVYWDEILGQWVDEGIRLNRRHTPRNLTSFWDAQGFPMLYVATDKGAYAYYRPDNRFYPTAIRPTHPQAGHGFTVWQEEGGVAGAPGQANQGNLFYSAGMAVRRYELGAVNAPVGLNRDDGVPFEHRGYIVDLRGAPGELYALVQGATDVVDEAGIDADTPGEDSPTYPAAVAYASVYYFTNSGWFEAWASDDAAGTPTKLFVSAADGALRLWWGFAGLAYSIELPADEHVPRQGLRAGVDRFRPSGRVQTGVFDAQMLGFDKIGRHLQLNVPTDPVGATATETITVKCRTDRSGGWFEVGTVSGTGRQILQLGDEGLPFEEIEFELVFARDPADETKSPLLDSFVLHFVKVPHAGKSWEFTVPLGFYDALWKGMYSGAQIKDNLSDLLSSDGLVSFTHNGVKRWTRLATVGGSDATGVNAQGERRISLVEIPLDHGTNLIEGNVP